jgi:lactate 2-monooxygenase
MSRKAFAYFAGGAGSEDTLGANREAFERRRIVPRVLRDVSDRSMRTALFGRDLPAPVFLSPIGVLELAHKAADTAAGSAAAELGLPFVFSSQASHSMEACAAAMGDGPRWFQLYWNTIDEVVCSFLKRAENTGCDAVVVTLDTTLLGWRPRDLDLGYLPFLRGKGIAQYTHDPAFLESLSSELESELSESKRKVTPSLLGALVSMLRSFPGPLTEKLRSGQPRRAVQQFIATYSRPSITWEDLPFLRENTTLPIILKGVLHPDDARHARDQGVDGLVVSNHGGRQIDGELAALDALPRIVDAVGDEMTVLFDSGVRSGADIFKALALGADAVGIGRPYAYGLAVDGERGARTVLENLLAELDLTMGLAGCRRPSEITRQSLERPDGR